MAHLSVNQEINDKKLKINIYKKTPSRKNELRRESHTKENTE